MPTLLYSPGIRVVIETAGNGIVDVSEDIQNGSLTITENASSSLSLTLVNHRRKYDGIFTPNDLVSVQMKRLRWIPVFAGYLNQVPYFSVYPRNIQLTASDTIKRLKYRLWDPGAEASYALLNSTGTGADGADQVDGGLRDRLITLLTEVADWPARNIHIGRLPDDWSDKMESLREKLAEQWAIDPVMLGLSGVANGTNPAAAGTGTATPSGPGTGVLPAMRGKATPLTGFGHMALTGESRTFPADQWYCAMRWSYAVNSSQGETPSAGITPEQMAEAKTWWRNRKLIVTNPKNNRAIIVRAADWGPNHATGKKIILSTHALTTGLGATVDDLLEIRFAPENSELGVTTVITQGTTTAGGTPPPTTTPQTVQGASGVRFTAADNLKPNCAAARSFIRANWHMPHGIGGYANRNIGGTNTPSDHAKGLALDAMVCPLGQRATGADEAKGNAIAMWFVQNPAVFTTKYVIWMDRINSGSGWRRYGHPTGSSGNTVQHRDHVHISFKNSGQTAAGAMGSGWPGGTPADFNNNVTAGNGADPGSGSGTNLINAFNWNPRPDPASSMLSGPRALMNDSPVLQTIAVMCQASMRSFMAAPNGDFIAWFPDYFGTYGTAAKMVIRDIELATDGFTISWSDEHLVTHQFTAGSTSGFSSGAAPVAGSAAVDIYRMIQTGGIASVEFPELMAALFNVAEGDPRSGNFLDPEAILQRFGARVNYQPMGQITGQEAEFWFACHLFQKNWASQFSAAVYLTFMPEVWPGMLLRLETFGFQAYVEQVTHTFGFSEGTGFKTEVRIIAPSAIGGGLYALPRADGIVVAEENLPGNQQPYGWGGGGGWGNPNRPGGPQA
jgi:hypothetical protein